MSDVVADFHLHTTASDGRRPLHEVEERARTAGLEAIAITDHDRLHPELDAPVERRPDLTVVRAIEMKVVRPSGTHVDLLAYGVRDTDRMTGLVERLQRDRIERGRGIRSCIEDRLDVTLELEIGPGIGRPHIARAVASRDQLDWSVQDVFDELIGDGCPCHVTREVPELAKAVEILREAAPIVAVAHPLRYEDVAGAFEIAVDLGAVERWYPYEGSVDEDRVAALARDRGLLTIGGSDAHNGSVGAAGMPRDATDRVLSILT